MKRLTLLLDTPRNVEGVINPELYSEFHFHLLMVAMMVSLDVRDELYCSICLGIFTDPVILPCGHNYCMDCISCVLDLKKSSGVYSCPECREEFQQRPHLLRNVTLRNIAERFMSAQPAQEETGISCTYCDSPAAKTCVHCEASLCAKHLQKHSNSPEHVLVDPTTSLDDRKCSTHNEVLRFYCTKDSTCICVTCRLDGDHRGHGVESLGEAAKKKKQNLRNLLQNMTSSRAGAEEKIRSLRSDMKSVQDKAADKTKSVTATFRDLRSQVDDLEKIALAKISEGEKQASCAISERIRRLETKMDELLRKTRRVQELCDLTDSLAVIQESKTSELLEIAMEDKESGEEYLKTFQAVGNLVEKVIAETVKISNIIAAAKEEITNPSGSVTLDGRTAAQSLRLSQNRKMASWITSSSSSPNASPQRFQDCSQVLSTLGFTSGQHCWETLVSEAGEWRIGVSYKTIDRAGDSSYLGCNLKSWCLSKSSNNRYSVIHDKKEMILSHSISCNRFRVYLDNETGKVSFYELCEPIRHLHTFTATFAEPLHAAFYVFGSDASIQITT